MKTLHAILFFVFSLLLITSCQKELNFEDTIGTSSGSLKKDSSDCLPSAVAGQYITDSALSGSNYIDVQVDVRFPGSYVIYSDTSNGFSFRDSGNFGTPGLNTVRLLGTGTPLLPGTHSFIIRYDTSVCIIDVEVQPAGANAVYTFAGAGGTCTGAVLSGTYMEGLPLTANNTAVVSIDITAIGNYSISSTQVNGVTFTATGVFNDTAQTTVTLTAQGTPLAAGTFNFALLGNGSSCAFSVTFDPPAPPAVFTLVGSPGNCSLATTSGTFAVGSPVTGNTVTLMVNITVVGSYSISTPVVNGVSFTGTGLFTSTGSGIPVSLLATGTATGPAGNVVFPFTGNGNSCSFTIPFIAAATDFITCNINGVLTTFNVNAAATLDSSTGIPILNIDGASVSTSSNPSINLGIVAGSGVTPATTYTTNQVVAGNVISCDYYDAANTDFFAGSDPLNQGGTPVFTIVVNTITATRIAGTFSGTVKDNNGAGPGIKQITGGVFDVPLL